MTAREHTIGTLCLTAAAALLTLLPWVAADTRGQTAAPLQSELTAVGDADLLLFFAGFPGCQGACPLAMQQLAAVQRQADSRFGQGRIAVAFLNLHFDTGPAGTRAYAQSFHPDFIGVSAGASDQPQLRKLIAQTGSSDIRALTRHKANVYVYQNTTEGWTLSEVYTRLPSPEAVVGQLAQLLTYSGNTP